MLKQILIVMNGFLGSQVLGAGVVSAVHDSADGAGQGDPELGSCRSSASSLRHSGS